MWGLGRDARMELCYEAAAIINEAPPQSPSLPPSFVCGIDTKDEKHGEGESEDLMKDR